MRDSLLRSGSRAQITSLTMLIFFLLRFITQASGVEAHSSDEAQAVSIETQRDIVYARAGNTALKLDYARPKSSKNTPVLVLIHGGGWKEGSRAAYLGEIQEAAKHGYFATTISHRLTASTGDDGKPLFPWPAAIHDCKAAIRHLRSNERHYSIDANRIAVCGASSGGHLALMLALTDESNQLEGDVQHIAKPPGESVSSQVAAAISLSGPTEMASCYYAPVVRPYANSLLGGGPRENPVDYTKASPIHYLSLSDPPVMLVHGGQDAVVPVEQSKLLAAESKHLGRVGDRLLVLPEEPHVFRPVANRQVWESVYAFLDECWAQSKSSNDGNN